MEDLAQQLGSALPAGPYSTVGGLFLAIAGHIPDEGDSVKLDGVTMTVLRMDRQRIDRLRVDTSRI